MIIPFDIWISICSIGLCVTSLPILINKKAQNPRRWSIAIGAILSTMMPAFFLQGDYLTTTTLTGQAVIWYLIAAFRPIRKTLTNQDVDEMRGIATGKLEYERSHPPIEIKPVEKKYVERRCPHCPTICKVEEGQELATCGKATCPYWGTIG